MSPLAFLDIGAGEMVVVAFVALLVYGGRLPDMMRKFGATYREFRRGLEDVSRNPLAPRAPPPPAVPRYPAYRPTASAGGPSDGPLLGAAVPVAPPASSMPAAPPMPMPISDPTPAPAPVTPTAPPRDASASDTDDAPLV